MDRLQVLGNRVKPLVGQSSQDYLRAAYLGILQFSYDQLLWGRSSHDVLWLQKKIIQIVVGVRDLVVGASPASEVCLVETNHSVINGQDYR